MMERRVAKAIDVDGELVLAHFGSEPDDATLNAVRDLVRATKTEMASLPPLCRSPQPGPLRIPCLREPDHEGAHRDSRGNEWQ